jgi:hypothetical protein
VEYAIEGDWGNAGISAAVVVPVLGDVAKAGQIGGKVASRVVKNADEVVEVVGDVKTYHRYPTKDADEPFKVLESGEVWGLPYAAGGGEPFVKAYVGPIPKVLKPGTRAYQFDTDVKPRTGTPPHIANWYPGQHGVTKFTDKNGKEWAKIPVRNVKIVGYE